MDMENIYRKIARKNGVSVEAVKKDMQAAIDMAFKNTREERENNNIYFKADVPNPEEIIKYALLWLKEKE